MTALGAVNVWPDVSPAPRPPGFRISGSATGLYPGAPGRLELTVRNPFRFAIQVRSISVRARDAGPCGGANLKPTRLRRPLVVPRRSSRRVVLPISLARDAPDACQGVVFRLTFSGTAVKA